MFNNKKGNFLRHPYATLTVIGLATLGVLSISEKVKNICHCKAHSVSSMFGRMKNDSDMMHNMNQ